MPTTDPQALENLCINTIRIPSADAVQSAVRPPRHARRARRCMAYTLWTKHMKFNPKNPSWADRDRFLLSAGHGSMLLYSLLHLTGYELPLSEIKRFRQWESMKRPVTLEQGRTPRRRSCHRTARPGFQQRSRNGDRRTMAGRDIQQTRSHDRTTTTLTGSAAMAIWWKASPTKPPRSPGHLRLDLADFPLRPEPHHLAGGTVLCFTWKTL